MISTHEVANGLSGALRLAGRDTSGYGYFDTTIGGFWRSFFAAAVTIPAYLIVMAVRPAETTIDASAFFLVETIAYVTAWFAFPLAMVYVADALDRSERYIQFVIARNWASVIQGYILASVAALEGMGVLPGEVGGFLALVATFWILTYQWFIARTALGIGGGMAVAVVLLEFAIELIILAVVGSIAG